MKIFESKVFYTTRKTRHIGHRFFPVFISIHTLLLGYGKTAKLVGKSIEIYFTQTFKNFFWHIWLRYYSLKVKFMRIYHWKEWREYEKQRKYVYL